MFNLFSIDAQQLDWLHTPPEDWADNQCCRDLQRHLKDIQVVNNAAERLVKAVKDSASLNQGPCDLDDVIMVATDHQGCVATSYRTTLI